MNIVRRNYKNLLSLLLLLISMSCSGCWLTRKIIFPADIRTHLPRIPGGQLIKIDSEDRQAAGFFIKRGDKLVVVLHGNGAAMYIGEGLAQRLIAQNFSVLMVEYPGYGVSAMYDSTESNLYTDARNLIQYIQQKHSIAPEDTTLWGYSLGSGVASYLAAQQLASNMVLVAPFTSVPDVAEVHYISLLPHLLIWDRFSTIGRAEDIKQPTLIFHGARDRTIPIELGREVHIALPVSAMYELPAAHHNNVYMHFQTRHWQKAYTLIRNGKLP